MMLLDSGASEALRRAAIARDSMPVALDQFDQFTLPGIMEMLATAIALPPENPFLAYFSKPSREIRSITECWRTWVDTNGGGQDNIAALGTDVHGTRTFEFYRLRTREDQVSERYQLFRERFVRSLQASAFPMEFSYAVAGAFGEMTDNIIQHSQQTSEDFTGMAGYHVCHGYMTFAVSDVGQGVLNSLKTSPVWLHLENAAAALRSAVCDNASRRPAHPKGDGFRTVFRSLVDRNAVLRFRSDDALLTLVGEHEHRRGAEVFSPPLAGLQLSVCCALKGVAEERPIISP
jgi:hypothetical protein